MADDFLYDVFLSHNARDKPRVRRLAERLRDAGLQVWFDDWNIAAGEIISLKVDEGLDQSRVLLLCLSPNALASNWVALERSTAVHRDPSNEGRRFIPLLLADCDLPGTLRRYKYVDYRDEGQAAFLEVLNACSPPPTQRPLRSDIDAPAQDVKAILRGTDTGARLQLHRRHTLTGHKKVITRLSWAPDGVRLASGSHDGVIGVWNTQHGTLERELTLGYRQLQKVIPRLTGDWREKITWSPAWSHNGRMIASGYGDGIIRVWNVATEKVVKTLTGHQFKVNNVAWSPDGKTLASSADDSLVKIWDVNTEQCVATLPGHDAAINTIAWHPTKPLLASASLDGTVRLWDTESYECVERLLGHREIVITVAWSPDGKTLASSSGDGTIRVWDPATGRQRHVLEGHRGAVSCISYSADGSLLGSKGIVPDSTVRIWQTSNWEPLTSFKELAGPMWFAGIAFHPTRPMLATLAEEDTAIRIWDLDLPTRIPRQARVERRSASKSVRYTSAKVVLLGEGGVGKTSLAHRLIDDKYVIRDRTHGMNVWRLDLPLPADATLEREVLLWDLAGQQDYRLIHQLFLNETALALLLVNAQQDDPLAEAGDWLKLLKTADSYASSAWEPTRLLVLSQVDFAGMKLGTARIKQFCEQHGLADWIATSAKTGENCSDRENNGEPSALKQLIASSIPWNKLPWTTTPHLLAELKDAIMAMRDKTDIRLMRFGELIQRLEQTQLTEKFEQADVRTAVALLANHGLARPLKFGDLVLLQPELMNGYASAIIRAARKHPHEIGCVLEADIYRADFDFAGVERLKDRADEELLLRALVQTFLDHALCIAEDTPQGRQLVFPSQYRREMDIPHEPNIFVSYTFSGEWQTVWTTLVTRLWYSQQFQHKELWRNAVEFSSLRGFTLGLKVDSKPGQGTAIINLYFDNEVPDDLKVIFIEYVHRHLEKFGCDVTRDRRYSCEQCGTPVRDLEAVRKRLAAKKDFITCLECDGKVTLVDFIEQRSAQDQVTQEVVAINDAAIRELDTQALEQVLIGHMMATCGQANQIFRPVTMFDQGIDGEVEFKDDNGNASGKRIYVQLKSGNSYLRKRKSDGSEIFDVKKKRHLEYWVSQPIDVYLVVRQADEMKREQSIRWMNITRYLKTRRDKTSRQIVFQGEELDMDAVWKVRDEFFPKTALKRN